MTPGRFALLAALVALAALARLAPHPPNVTPVGALAVFAGAVFRDRRVAVAVPLGAMLLSDLVLGLHVLIPLIYASFAANVLIGRWLAASRTAGGVAAATLLGAAQFYLVTNAACHVLYHPPTASGLAACYADGLPYLGYSLLGDAGYAAVLFGGLALAERAFPAVREPAPVAA